MRTLKGCIRTYCKAGGACTYCQGGVYASTSCSESSLQNHMCCGAAVHEITLQVGSTGQDYYIGKVSMKVSTVHESTLH